MPTTPPPSILSRLRPPPSSKTKSKPKALPPLSLPSPTLVSQHTPCTLHTSILPPELACRLFYTMLDEAKEWKRNKWWLFDRLVESPHRTGFYTRMERDGDGGEEVDEEGGWKEAAQFWYNGRETKAPSQFPAVMEEACTIIERVVNEELRKRPRFPLEWAGYPPDQSRPNGDRDSGILWRANVAASNCYEGAKESVGYHSDSLTYLGPYPTIASLSLGTTRIFRLREVIPSDEINLRQPRTYNIPVTHNSLLIMHASTQEKFKHTVPPQPTIDLFRPPFPRQSPPFASSSSSNPDHQIEPSNCRINITFRFYRPDFHPSTIPRCKCGVPAVLKPDMKNRHRGRVDRFWWHCNAGAQNEGKDCGFWKVLDMKGEGRGPCVGDVEARVEQENTSI
ncbi:hypothetical protein JAAARDRAFT_55409 [Jaapia argillacea MUCL 33604]|uniref:Fe2OG dioxygenase domain-containing protein n=1 Tax=Jaapia argillacea MUCL 33604 TaxID=933084 RepID=A0A067Q3D1_9AGAM|nr:hypothetical protein JAAARDRAFT_55409 [Jaapia argillacea MUCL 33604]